MNNDEIGKIAPDIHVNGVDYITVDNAEREARRALTTYKAGIKEQVEKLPTYEVTDDVKTESGELVEFFEKKVICKADILTTLSE